MKKAIIPSDKKHTAAHSAFTTPNFFSPFALIRKNQPKQMFSFPRKRKLLSPKYNRQIKNV